MQSTRRTSGLGAGLKKLDTARDLIVDICESLARFGPRRFDVSNTGISTIKALDAAAQILAAKGSMLRYSNLRERITPLTKTLARQAGGSQFTPASISRRKRR